MIYASSSRCLFCGSLSTSHPPLLGVRVALPLTETLSINLQIILLNIFAAELSLLLGSSVLFLGHPARVHNMESVNYVCNFVLSAIFSSGFAKLPATSLYAVVVYIYIKHGTKKLKWYVIALCIALFWIASISIGLMPYASTFNVVSNQGFCYADSQSSIIPIIIPAMFVSLSLISVSFTVAFGILTFCHAKKNVFRKKDQAVIKAVIIINVVFSLITNCIVPSVVHNAQREDSTEVELTMHTTIALILTPTVLTPIITIMLLRPLRDILKGKCVHHEPAATNRQVSTNMATVIPNIQESAMGPKPAMGPEPAVNPEQAMDPEPAVNPEQAMDLEPANMDQLWVLNQPWICG